MTTQEKINQLANAALHAAPPPTALPKPATFTPSPEKLGIPMEVEVPKPILNEAPVLQPEVEEVTEEPASTFQHQTDPEFGALIEERDGRVKKKLFRQRLVANLVVLGILASAGTWYATSARAQAAVASLIPAIRQSGNDFKMLGSILGQFDKSLKKVGTRRDQIDEATRNIGVDPSAASAEADPQMEKEMNDLTGGEGGTTGGRDRALKDKFGFVAKLAGEKGKVGQGKDTTEAEP